MNEEQYLSELEQLLMNLKVKDRLDILRDVSEYFTSGRLEGRSDEELARELGAPSVLVSELLASVDIEESVSTRPPAVVKSSNVAFQSVLIQVQNAQVFVTPSQDGYAYATLETETDHGVVMDIVGDTLEIRIEFERRFGLSDLFSWFGSKAPVLRVELPHHAYHQIQLKNRHGSSDVQDLQAERFHVESENGRIVAHHIQARHGVLRTSNGKVLASSCHGHDWELHSSNGRVEAKHSQLERINIHSSNGRIDVDHVTGAVDAKTSNGRIDCSVQAIQAPIRLKTNNGKIDLHVDERPEDVTIRAKSRNGKVDVFGERSKECVFGDGSIEVKLTSSNGSVTVSG